MWSARFLPKTSRAINILTADAGEYGWLAHNNVKLEEEDDLPKIKKKVMMVWRIYIHKPGFV